MNSVLLARVFRPCLGLLALCLALAVPAAEVAVAPVLDLSGLPALGDGWLKGNPYRGSVRALAVGQSAFNQSCARCHGADASPVGGAPAPDLRQLNRYCRNIAEAGVQAACMADNDYYFRKTVQHGKIIVGVVHMPSWKDVLSQEVVWAIQAFVESRIVEGRP
jgi:mono/diheme cytochrome c family protein